MEKNLIPIDDAAEWASNYLKKNVSESNISYLVNYGKIKKYKENDRVLINKNELKKYYDEFIIKRKEKWKEEMGEDLNWDLALIEFSERERTKHVHRLHSYKGKFIPQLVEYFLDEHTNKFKKERYFQPGNIIIDPFVGSGTTLVQAMELGIHSIGIDISKFNCLISRIKIVKYNISETDRKLRENLNNLMNFCDLSFDNTFFKEMDKKISQFNQEYFPSPEIKRKMLSKEVNEKEYAKEKMELFFKQNPEYKQSMKNRIEGSKQKTLVSFTENREEKNFTEINKEQDFMSKWYRKQILQELFYYRSLIDEENNPQISDLMKVILTRTARSCRATTHIDLGTLKKPVFTPYYCRKHRKICRPTNTIVTLLRRYTLDTIRRIKEFSQLKKQVYCEVLHGDSRNIEIEKQIEEKNPKFGLILKERKADGIFTSPPYVGQIDYHEQHAYAYELLDLERKDKLEIGPQFKGESIQVQEEYVIGIAEVLSNLKRFLKKEAEIFLVANDKHNLYPEIAEKSGLMIVEEFLRPVLHRTEADNAKYAEKIFRMKKER